MSNYRRGSGYCQDPLPRAPVVPDEQAFIVLDTIADLRTFAFSVASFPDGQLIYVKGYYSAQDDGGGFFNYHRSGTVSDDGGRFIIPHNGYGYYERLFDSGVVTARQFGANGLVDDTVMLQAGMTAAVAVGLPFTLGNGNTFLISSTLLPDTGLRMSGRSTIKAISNSLIGSMIHAVAKAGIRISEIVVHGNGDSNGARNGIHFSSGSINVVELTYVHDTIEAGIRIESESGTQVVLNQCVDCGRTGYTDNHGIMVFATTGTVRDILVNMNTVVRAYRKGITVYSAAPGAAKNIQILGNTVYGCDTGGIYCANAAATTDQSGLVVSCNTCYENYVNVEIVNTAGFTCVGNVSRDDLHFGMAFTDVTGGTISANWVEDSQIHGILVNGSSGSNSLLTVTGNTVVRPNRSAAGFGAGLYVTNTLRSNFTGNTISDESSGTLMSHGILEDGTSAQNLFDNNSCFNSTLAANLIVLLGQSIALANGANNNLAVALQNGIAITTGPTGAYSITGIAGGYYGRQITIVNYVNQTLTIAHNSGSSAAGNKILIGGSADITVAVYGSVTLQFDAVANAWFVVGYKG